MKRFLFSSIWLGLESCLFFSFFFFMFGLEGREGVAFFFLSLLYSISEAPCRRVGREGVTLVDGRVYKHLLLHKRDGEKDLHERMDGLCFSF